jgi:hypothetical protein
MTIPRLTFERAMWLFPAAVTVHNLEEALWLPAWSQQPGALGPPIGESEFRFALGVLTALAFVMTGVAARMRGAWLAATAAYWVAMLANVVVPHLVASVIARRYTPGVVTAVALNLPVTTYLLRRALGEKQLEWRRLLRASAWFIPALVGSIPLLFAVGRWLARREPG